MASSRLPRPPAGTGTSILCGKRRSAFRRKSWRALAKPTRMTLSRFVHFPAIGDDEFHDVDGIGLGYIDRRHLPAGRAHDIHGPGDGAGDPEGAVAAVRTGDVHELLPPIKGQRRTSARLRSQRGVCRHAAACLTALLPPRSTDERARALLRVSD